MTRIHEYHWEPDDILVVDGVELVASTVDRFRSTPDRFCLVKTRDLVEAHLRLLDELEPERMVEIGILEGGSVAMTALLARPEALIAIERSPERVVALDAMLTSHQLADTVHAVYGMDQSDTEQVREVVLHHIDPAALDLVIDDASHLVGPTRATFETLFPLLRPGGHYVIEDWTWAHVGFGAKLPNETPLSRFVFEVVLALPSFPGLIAEIRIDRFWADIVRGDLHVTSLDLPGSIRPRGRDLLA